MAAGCRYGEIGGSDGKKVRSPAEFRAVGHVLLEYVEEPENRVGSSPVIGTVTKRHGAERRLSHNLWGSRPEYEKPKKGS